MTRNPYAKIKQNAILTASPQELTLMLYDGAIKFANQAIDAIEKDDIEKANNMIIRVQDIIDELRLSLDSKYPIAEEMDALYEFILFLLKEANIEKSTEKITNALDLIRDFRDTWKQVMEINKANEKKAL